MKNIRPILEGSLPENFVGVGIVTSVREGSPYCIVELRIESRALEILATKALDFTLGLVVGDRVLCVGSADKALYITMLLEREETANEASLEPVSEGNITGLNSKEGVNARIVPCDSNEMLQVYNKRNELIFEYDEVNDRSRVVVEAGSLEFAVPQGDIKLSAGGQIKLEGGSVAMIASQALSAQRSSLSLGQFKADLQSPILKVNSSHAKFEFDEAFYTGKKLSSNISSAKIVWGKVETLADHLIGKFKTHFTVVEELSQTKAGRMRTLISGAYRLKAERVNLKTEKSVNIDGERINLG